MSSFFSGFSWMEILKASTVLFAVIDIIGSIPVVLKIKKSAGHIYPLRATLVSLGIMIGFLFIGESILNLLGVDEKSFAVAGSFILFALSFEMILGIQIFKDDDGPKTASIVPLAFPIIAGAGTMTTLVVLRAEYAEINIVLAIIINIILVYIVLRLSKKIEQFLGAGGMAILKKVFGIILLAIAVKLFTSNLKALL